MRRHRPASAGNTTKQATAVVALINAKQQSPKPKLPLSLLACRWNSAHKGRGAPQLAEEDHFMCTSLRLEEAQPFQQEPRDGTN
jgi:hypothetical protein